MNHSGMFFPQNKKFNKKEEKVWNREKLIFDVTEDLLVLMEDFGISKSDLAKKLGKSKSYVTQVLDGNRNMTLGSLSDICYELNISPKVNYFHNETTEQLLKVDIEESKDKADTTAQIFMVANFSTNTTSSPLAVINFSSAGIMEN